MLGRSLVSTLVLIGTATAQNQNPSAADLWKQHMDSGMKLENRGQYAEAREELQAALRAASSLPKDGRTFLVRIELGSVAASTGQYIEAEQWNDDAIRLGIELYGKESSRLATPLTNLAALYRDQGDSARAEEFCRRALQVLPEGTDPAVRANVLGVLGGILSRSGKLEEAEASLQQSIQTVQKLPAASGILAADWNNLAEVYAKTGRNAEALATYRDAYALCSKIGGSNDPNLFFILAGMAALEARSGQYSDAVRTIQSAVERSGAGGPAATLAVRNALLAEAEWLHKLKRDGEAKRVRARAQQVGKAAIQNSYSQYTVDARQVAQGMVGRAE